MFKVLCLVRVISCHHISLKKEEIVTKKVYLRDGCNEAVDAAASGRPYVFQQNARCTGLYDSKLIQN